MEKILLLNKISWFEVIKMKYLNKSKIFPVFYFLSKDTGVFTMY